MIAHISKSVQSFDFQILAIKSNFPLDWLNYSSNYLFKQLLYLKALSEADSWRPDSIMLLYFLFLKIERFFWMHLNFHKNIPIQNPVLIIIFNTCKTDVSLKNSSWYIQKANLRMKTCSFFRNPLLERFVFWVMLLNTFLLSLTNICRSPSYFVTDLIHELVRKSLIYKSIQLIGILRLFQESCG